MQIGSEKLLLSLGVPVEKTTDLPLSLNDVEVLNISVEKSWNGEKISNTLADIEQRMGASPVYVISDNASIMRKGVRDSSLTHLPDVGHTMAMFLERQYYLLPPSQRIVARFMNLTPVIEWAKKMLCGFHSLSEQEQQVFQVSQKLPFADL